jgi:hypothetical protein
VAFRHHRAAPCRRLVDLQKLNRSWWLTKYVEATSWRVSIDVKEEAEKSPPLM